MRRGLLLGLVIVLCSTAQPAAAAQAPGKLVVVGYEPFARSPAHDGLYVLNADGTGLRQLTHGTRDSAPRWSPDGSAVVFTRDESAALVNADGTRLRVLGPLAAGAPAWSPDGTRVAWSGCGGVCVEVVATAQRHGVALGGATYGGLTWSPDGTEIAAVDPEDRLVVVAAGGGAPHVVASGPAEAPAWSPDGSAIAYADRGTQAVKLVAAAGGAARTLAQKGYDPSWSHDGRTISFSNRGAFAVDVASGRVTTIAAAVVGDAAWSPDGTAAAFARRRVGTGDSDVWTAGVDGAAPTEVTAAFPTGVSYSDPDWTAGTVPPVAPPRWQLLRPAAAAAVTTNWVDALVRAPNGGVAYANENVVCNADAYTTASVFHLWTPPANDVVTTSTPCGDFENWGEFGVGAGAIAWAASAILTPEDRRAFVAAARFGTRGNEAARWQGDSYDKHIGRVGGIGELQGDGRTVVFETWSDRVSGRRVLTVHRRLWRLVGTTRVVGRKLPPDAEEILAVDAGRVLLSGTRGLVMTRVDGRVLRRYPIRATLASLGGGELGTCTGSTLSVYDVRNGKVRSRLPLDASSGTPSLRTIRGDYAVYVSGIAVHVLRLHDGLDRVLDLPGQAGPVDALLTERGLYVSYDEAYADSAGHVLFVPVSSLG